MLRRRRTPVPVVEELPPLQLGVRRPVPRVELVEPVHRVSWEGPINGSPHKADCASREDAEWLEKLIRDHGRVSVVAWEVAS